MADINFLIAYGYSYESAGNKALLFEILYHFVMP